MPSSTDAPQPRASSDGSELALSPGTPVAARLPRTNHFGFRLADDAAVRTARERLGAAGVEETEWQDDGRFVRVQVTDPDGYRVEVYAHRTGPAGPTAS